MIYLPIPNTRGSEIDFFFIQIFLAKIFFILFGFMVFNATFNNISDVSWQSVLLVVKIMQSTRRKLTNFIT